MKYFAYGSNTLVDRLVERVPSARPIGPAVLFHHRIMWHKLGTDGSGKCDIIESAETNSRVWGVLYEFDDKEMILLDRAESFGYGYEQKPVIVYVDERSHEAFAYYAIQTNPLLRPFHWYKDFVISGAEQNGLPLSYLNELNAVESIEDPNRNRGHRNRMLLENNNNSYGKQLIEKIGEH